MKKSEWDEMLTETQALWAYRRAAQERRDMLEWMRWQLEMDLSPRSRVAVKHRIPLKKRLETLNTYLEGPKFTRCSHCCKSMYFCELKEGHRGLHQCAGGNLKWSTKEGFFP